jgi:hypothetical protein
MIAGGIKESLGANRGKSCICVKLTLGPSCVSPPSQLKREWSSVARIRLDFRKSVGLFKAIICDDISEFES